MKKILELILVVILAMSLFALNVSADSKPTLDVKKGTPVIDGKIDDMWQYVDEMKLDRPGSDVLADATAYAKLLWDDENLYGICVVTDTTKSSQTELLHLEDCLEVFFDLNNQKTDEYSETNQFRFLYDGITPLETSIRNPDNISPDAIDNITLAFSEPDETTYIYEFQINYKVGDSFAFKADLEIGFDIGYDDNTEDDGVRTGSIFWNAEDNVSAIPSQMGTIKFVDVQAVPESVPVADTAVTDIPAADVVVQPAAAEPAPVSVPATGDNAVIYILFSAVLAGMVFIAARKLKAR